jgi:hypothetical protein
MQDIINKLHFSAMKEELYFSQSEYDLYMEAIEFLVEHSLKMGVTEEQLVKRLHRQTEVGMNLVGCQSPGLETERGQLVLVKANIRQCFLNLRRTNPEVGYLAWELIWEEHSNNDFFGEYFLDYDPKFTQEDFKIWVEYISIMYEKDVSQWDQETSLAAFLAEN